MLLRSRVLFFFMAFPFLMQGQNLIHNPSFEAYKKCPKELVKKRLKLKAGVSSVNSTPDYFHNCSSNFSPENNPFGSQKPYHGEAFCGLTLTSYYPDECASRDYIQLELIQQLEAGKKYIFSMKLSLADTSGYYTDQIGVYFYNDKLSKKEERSRFIGKASLNNASDSFLSNSKEWQELKWLYNAKGGERYLMIGNFQKCNRTSRKAVLPNGMADSLKKYEDKNPHRGYQPSPTVLDNMKRKFREDIGGSTLKAYNLAYYFIDDLSLTAHQLNDSLSFLEQNEACSKELESNQNKENLVADGNFSLNKEGTNPYWKTASRGTPDFLKNRVGLYLYSDVGKNNREYIITKLRSQLSPCKKYFFSVRVRRNEAYRYTVDQLQAAVVDSNYFAEDRMRFDFKPFFRSPKNKIIDNTEEWIKVCGEFSPNSCSNYLIIGNFSSDDSTFIFPTEYAVKDGPYAYYFIDDVELFELDSIAGCVQPCQEIALIDNGLEESDKIVFPGDTLRFYFESSSAYTKNKIDRRVFEEFIRILKQDTSIQVMVEGHADASGNEASNVRLSKARAMGVYEYLLQLGIDRAKLKMKYFGSKNPKAPNSNKKMRALNRRVEVYLSKGSDKKVKSIGE